MPYDKENIKKADKAGVFIDSPIDAQVLASEEDERIKMKKEIEDITKKEKNGDISIQPEEKKLSKIDIKKENERLRKKLALNLWERIVLWFKSLFGGYTAQYKFLTKKELKRTKSIIQNFTPQFYNFKDSSSVRQRITKEFGQAVFNIYHTFLKIYTLFEDAVKDEDEININEDSFFIRYETELISDSAKNILERLSKNRIVELFDHHDNASVAIEKELHNFKSEVETKDYRNIETYSEIFEAILLLRKLNFTKFFTMFDKNFAPAIKYKPNDLSNIYVNELRECDNFLKDFDVYLTTLSEIMLPENVAMHFDKVMGQVLEESKEDTTNEDDLITIEGSELTPPDTSNATEDEINVVSIEENEIEIEQKRNKYADINISSKHIKEFLKTIKTLAKSEVITAMVKYIYNEPTYETRAIPLTYSFFDKYLLLISKKAIETSKQSEQLVKDKQLKENIKSLFNIEGDTDTNISYIGNYNPISCKKLEEKKLSSFEYTKSIALLKMFFDKHYIKYMRELIDKLVVEGEFSDKSIGTQLSNYIYSLEDDNNNLKEFKKLVEDSDSIKTFLRGVNASGSLDSAQRSVILNKISEMDSNAKAILESTLPKLLEIQSIIVTTVEDSKAKSPTFVYNIKTIGGLTNRAYLSQLSATAKKIMQFLKIMKNFHIIVPNLKKKKRI